MHTLAVLLALLHAVLGLTATVEKSVTADEIAHLTAGVSYNRLNDYRLQPENGNLPQRWAGFPATLSRAPLPPTTSDYFTAGNVWGFGRVFLYEQGISSDVLLFAGRGMIALFSAATGLLIFYWSRALFGWRGGFLSLALFAFSPTFLAHGALTTSDVVMTFFFLAAAGAWARHLARPGAGPALLSVIVLGLACVAKFSAVLLVPIHLLVALAWVLFAVPPSARASAALRVLRSGAVHAFGAWAIIWLFYGVRYSAISPVFGDGTFSQPWSSLVVGLGRAAPVIEFCREWRVFPEAFLYGFTFVVQYAQQRAAFLNGDYSLHGWVSFFPYAFVVKSTPALLVTVVAAVAVAARSLQARWRRGDTAWCRFAAWQATPLLALFVVYWATSLTSHLNIGHRHILPTYPALFIAAGALGFWLTRAARVTASLILLLLCWHVVESARIRPHYLAYFNVFAGGPAEGWKHLVDSSLDWGQDLPGLRAWLDEHAAGERQYLSYFGTGEPSYEGIRATLLPTLPDSHRTRPWHELSPGVYAIGATMLQHVYSPIRGPWTLKLEDEYQQLRRLEPTLLEYQRDPDRRAELTREISPEKWHLAWRRYELLRFARLCYYLRVREPDAMIGYSILIYRLSPAELQAATGGSLQQWRDLIERAVTRN